MNTVHGSWEVDMTYVHVIVYGCVSSCSKLSLCSAWRYTVAPLNLLSLITTICHTPIPTTRIAVCPPCFVYPYFGCQRSLHEIDIHYTWIMDHALLSLLAQLALILCIVSTQITGFYPPLSSLHSWFCYTPCLLSLGLRTQ